MSIQERLQHLIAELPEGDLLVAERLLHGLKLTRERGDDPLQTFLDGCPEDDEPYTAEEERSDQDAWARYQSGQWIAHDEMLKRDSHKVH